MVLLGRDNRNFAKGSQSIDQGQEPWGKIAIIIAY
jgi:hypothetical protein